MSPTITSSRELVVERQIEPSGFVNHINNLPPRPSNRRIAAHVIMALVLAGIGAQVGFFGSHLLPQRWLARTEVEYRGSSWTETQDIAIKSRSLIVPVASERGIPIDDFERDLDAGLVPSTQILRVDYTSSDPDEAKEIVAEVADAYVDAVAEVPSGEDKVILTDRLTALQDQLAKAQTALVALPAGPTPGLTAEQQAATSEVTSLQTRIDGIETRLLENDLAVLDATANGVPKVITQPYVFEDAVSPKPKLMAVVGGVVGLVIGLAWLTVVWNSAAWSSRNRPTW